MRRPGPRIGEGAVTHVERRAVDPDRAAAEHAAYRELLAGAGWDVREVEPADDLPDAPFVEDAAVALDGRVVLTRPGHSARRAEVESVAAALEALGVPAVPLPGHGTLDGGDVLRVGGRLFVGRSTRTDEAGFAALARLAREHGLEPVAVPVRACLHLKTAATALPDGTVIVAPDHVDARAFAPGPTVAAPEPSGANVLLLGGERVAVAASAPRTADLLRDRGLDVSRLDIAQFEAVEAGLTCLSVLLPGR
ncbi:MAG TPA: arginine deiminase family protein [Solirubrobacteraceae bacterium]|nr:arginine deiminase family protein [Solirubrobacteraceae bacterium]